MVGLYGLPALKEGQIRLLRTAVDSQHQRIRCTISIHDLLDRTHLPEFAALSYTWGPCHQGHCKLQRPARPAASRNTIFCNDESVDVTENLYDFLYQWSSVNEVSTYLWIDALCINQHNIPEQSHQVNIMGQIYTAAHRVLIWLGSEDDSTGLAFELMEDLCLLDKEAKLGLNPHEVCTQNANPLLVLNRWKALSHLFSRTWFSRAWTIQEAVLARTRTVICGSNTTSWEKLANVSGFLATSNWDTFLKNPVLFGYVANQGHKTPARLAAGARTWEGFEEDNLLYALIRARPSICQDPRDKVYSQLALGRADLFPDYNRTVTEVFLVAAGYILKQSGNMLLLACVEGEEFQNPAYDLPSWVPDWTCTEFLGLRITGYKHFNASGTRAATYSISQDNRTLLVEAAWVDRIVETCENKGDLRANLQSSTLWHLISKLESIQETTHGTQSREEVVWRTLMTNRGSHPPCYPTPDDLMQSFRDWILWRYALALQEPTTFPVWTGKDSMLPTQTELESTRVRAIADSAFVASLAHRASLFDVQYSHAMLQRPFRTKHGYFGIGSQCLQEGDSVWIISGCRVPIILRRVDRSKHYRLVGGSYTHNLMDGEALNRAGVQFDMVSIE